MEGESVKYMECSRAAKTFSLILKKKRPLTGCRPVDMHHVHQTSAVNYIQV